MNNEALFFILGLVFFAGFLVGRQSVLPKRWGDHDSRY